MTHLLLRSKISIKPILVIVGLLLVMLLVACGSGSIQFVDENGIPYADSVAHIACFTEAEVHLHTYKVELDSNGYGGLPEQAQCPKMLTIIPVVDYPAAPGKIDGADGNGRQPPFDNAFTVYATSWIPGKSTPTAPSAAVGVNSSGTPALATTVEVRRDQPLILFNVVASVEWAFNESEQQLANYVYEVKEGLRNASSLLYDVTEGQMAFGNTIIYGDGSHWNGADIRIKVDNNYRPSASIGGIINADHDFVVVDYADRVNGKYVLPWGGEAYFSPGSIFLGRLWDGYSADAGSWDQPSGARTIMHEWGHYGIGWGDQYRSIVGAVFCPCPDVTTGGSCTGSATSDPSVMAYQYNADEAWYSADVTPSLALLCDTTQQNQLYGIPEWDAFMQDWEDVFQFSTTAPDAFSLSEVGSITQLDPDSVEMSSALEERDYARYFVAETIVSLEPDRHAVNPWLKVDWERLAVPNPNAVVGHVYVYDDDAGNELSRATYQGVLDEDGMMQLAGIRPNDRIYVFIDDYATGVRHVLVDPAFNGSQMVVPQPVGDPWDASLNLAISCEGGADVPFDKMSVTVFGSLQEPQVQLCSPDSAELCTPLQPMAVNGNRASYTFAAPLNTTIAGITTGHQTPELPDYGVVRVVDGQRELFSWYQNEGGGGSAHMTGDTPMADGLVDVEANVPMVGRNNQVLLTPANPGGALHLLPNGTDNPVFGIVGVPFDLSIIQVDKQGACQTGSGLPIAVNINTFYDKQYVDEVFGDANITMYSFVGVPGDGVWVNVEIEDAANLGELSERLLAARLLAQNQAAKGVSSTSTLPDSLRDSFASRDAQAAATDKVTPEPEDPDAGDGEQADRQDVLHWFTTVDPVQQIGMFVIVVETPEE